MKIRIYAMPTGGKGGSSHHSPTYLALVHGAGLRGLPAAADLAQGNGVARGRQHLVDVVVVEAVGGCAETRRSTFQKPSTMRIKVAVAVLVRC